MARRGRNGRRGSGKLSRRSLLTRLGLSGIALLGAGGLIQASNAYTTSAAGRSSTVKVAEDGSALIGIRGLGPVKKNTRGPMVELTNRAQTALTFYVTLEDCSHGILYNNSGGSGCSVSSLLLSGSTQFFDIEAAITGTIPFRITVSGAGFSFEAAETILSETGNVAGAVLIQHPTKDQDFTARVSQNQFELKSVDVRDNDDDDDLAEVKYEVQEAGGGGTVIASKTISNPPPDRYSPSGNPAEVILPNVGYSITSGTLYRLTMTATDADGNFATSTVETTA